MSNLQNASFANSVGKEYCSFYSRDAMLVWVFARTTLRRYCIKMKKASIVISSLSGSATILVFILRGSPRGPQTRVRWENSAIF